MSQRAIRSNSVSQTEISALRLSESINEIRQNLPVNHYIRQKLESNTLPIMAEHFAAIELETQRDLP